MPELIYTLLSITFVVSIVIFPLLLGEENLYGNIEAHQRVMMQQQRQISYDKLPCKDIFAKYKIRAEEVVVLA